MKEDSYTRRERQITLLLLEEPLMKLWDIAEKIGLKTAQGVKHYIFWAKREGYLPKCHKRSFTREMIIETLKKNGHGDLVEESIQEEGNIEDGC